MLSHVKRFHADLRRVGGWVIAIALATLVVSILATYMAVFSVAQGRSGTLATAPPREPLSFLRSIDPNESIVRVADSPEELEESVLEEPGLGVLLDQMLRDDRMFIVLPLGAFTFDYRSPGSGGVDARAVVGAAPPFLPEVPGDATVLLWGSLEDGAQAAPGVSDSSIHGHAVHRVTEERLAARYVAGSGHRAFTQDMATAAFDVPTARELGVLEPPHVSEVVRGFTCYCDVSELAGLADAMSEAESRAGTGRVFYAVGYDGLIGPVQRSRALSETLNAGHALATLLSVWCLVAMVAQVFWTRRSRAYAVERLCGSSEMAIHMRSQLLIAFSLTLPALAGYELVNAALRHSTSPPPLSPEVWIVALAGALVLHALAGAVTALRVHRLCESPMDEVRRV